LCKKAIVATAYEEHNKTHKTKNCTTREASSKDCKETKKKKPAEQTGEK
jgi:hypothetical protein